jgi:hypothetical protein
MVAKMQSGREPTHADVNIHADPRDPDLVSGFELVSAQAFPVYRMDPYVVVLCPSGRGDCVVGVSSQGAGPDIHSCASGFPHVVLDTPGGGDPGLGRFREVAQQ